jgi:type I restriction enzyme, S subunit
MNADRLLAHYEQIADAPAAVARLRRFILDLAVRGKLVPQEAKDEPASELLKRIAKEKARLVKAGEIRKLASPEVVAFDEQPFAIPQTWKWVRLRDILTKLTDGTHHSPPNQPTGDFKYITAKNIKNEGVLLDDVTYVSRKIHDEIFTRCNPVKGDILYIKDGATTGIVTVNDLEEPFSMLSSVALLKLPECIFNRLVVEFLRSPFFYDQMRGFMKGAAITRVTLKRMGPALIPLPPLAEQHRLVAKVDELMGLCDRLEAAQAAREGVRDRLAAASLARLNAADPDTFQADARFALATLPALTTRPDQIKTLRQTILNLAVRGKLVDGTTAKAASVGDYRTLQNGYAFKSSWFSKEGVRLLRNANIGHGEIRWNDVVHLPVDRLSEFERFQLNEGDIVLTLDRPFIVTGTKVARVSADDLPSLLLQRVGRFVETSPGLDDGYLFLWINSPHFNDQIDPGRSNGVPHISSKQVEAAEIFVAPLAEQRRIVAKVDALMALCDRLEASLTAAANTRRSLLDALLAEALAPDEERELEAAE